MDSNDNKKNNNQKQVEKNSHFLQAFGHSIAGIGELLVRERNMHFHIFAACIVLIVGIYVDLGRSDWLWISVAVFTVISAEFLNTIVEAIVDLIVGENYHPLAKVAKDVASGGVLAAAVFAVVIGVLIFQPYLLPNLQMVFR
ncbi:diacylglycerol kinase family protein [Weissella hellenica]|nr:diacylglycerol kinase family protein [Weissella hellenica]GED36605.1 diacylglycerol kinase [Weissella hellenica]SCC06375.1 diacylglycerol kinase (ATP) [Weissella hellenica]